MTDCIPQSLFIWTVVTLNASLFLVYGGTLYTAHRWCSQLDARLRTIEARHALD